MKKATLHMGKQGASKHNDRTFNLDNAPHIHQEMKGYNRYIYLQGREEMTFEEMELDYYKEHYGEALAEQNKMYEAKRQKGRMKNMEYWVKHDKQKKPDEFILQVGNKKDSVDGYTLLECMKEFCGKISKKYGANFHMLDMALHMDEETPHAHLRGVFDYEENGIRKIGTDRALKELGIEAPKPNEKIGRYNNRKQTFTEEVRKLWHEVIKEHGIQIDEEVKNPSQKHKTTLEYKCQQLEKEIKEKERQIKQKDKQLKEAYSLLEEAEKKDIELLGYSPITTQLKKYKEYEEEHR